MKNLGCYQTCCIALVSSIGAFEVLAEDLSSYQMAWQAKGELSLNQSRHQPHGLQPWWQGGTGQLGSSEDTLMLGPQLFATQITTDSAWSGTLHAQWHQQPTADLGVTEAWLTYSPLPLAGYRTNIGETVPFADYPSIRTGPLALQPNWVQPTRELDHRTGFYTGLHWSFEQRSEVRVYYYDNNGDPLVIKHGQYAWDTQFSSIAWQQELSEQLRFVAQYLTGSTEMGPQAVVVDFKSWFSLLHYDLGHSRLSIRYDYWQQQDMDLLPGDDNQGKGHGWNINLQYPIHDNLSLALEWSELNTLQASRGQWPNWPVQQTFQQLQLLLTWRWQSAD